MSPSTVVRPDAARPRAGGTVRAGRVATLLSTASDEAATSLLPGLLSVTFPARIPAQCTKQGALVEPPGTIDMGGPEPDDARGIEAGRARCGQRCQGDRWWRRSSRGDVGQEG